MRPRPGSGDVLAGLPGVRVLSGGSEPLMPAAYQDTAMAASRVCATRVKVE
ncbi:hypothetical protein GCM10023220_60110 [Streptomyces ziwulingensis]|uniref:Uncharacterized protein n=1 Tax=Streptomyces ziwulingensis TaxID=1045501 RepID=A0ABP9CU42_9ACTN